MTVKLKRWHQDRWLRSNIDLFADQGDYKELSNLEPTLDNRRLQRIPSWSAQVRTDTNALTNVRAMFYDQANSRYVLIGTDGSNDLASAYLSSSWTLSATTTLHTTPSTLGGLSMRNFSWFGGYVWVIGDDGKVYRGTSYTAALTQFDGTTSHKLLQPIGHRLYAVHTNGRIERVNAGNDAFSSYTTPYNDLTILHIEPFRAYALLIGQQPTGALNLYRVAINAESTTARMYQHIATLYSGGTHPDYGSLFTLHNDQFYFSPGYITGPDSHNLLPIYTFNGSQLKHITTIDHAPNTGGSGYPDAAGLISWRNHLIYYALDGTSQIFKALHNDKFIDHAALTATVTAIHPIAANLGAHLLCTAKATNQGIHHLQDTTLSDAHIITSHLGMDNPGALKRLETITVLLDGKASDFKILLKYRTNDNTDWTTATTANNTHHAHVAALGVEFYQLQLRIDLDDDSGGNQNIAIKSISCRYVTNE